MSDEKKDKENDIPEMNLDQKYAGKSPSEEQKENSEGAKKELDKTKKELEKLKTFILKKYPFTQVLSVLPPASIKEFIEEEEVPKESEKHIHLYMIVPEENFKEYEKIKTEIVKQIEELKQKIWVQIKTPVDLWETCLDGKFELVSAIAMSYPLHDSGILGALRVAEIHKSLVLQKFEKYVVSYVIGGSLVRGEAVPTSDVDVFMIINDTDVKKMPRLELKERLRSIIYQYVAEASAIAGVQNKLSPQIYLLTDFWESVKDAHPVIFTFIRDGIPIYDRGTFMPWKSLLRMGKLKPSPEAIDTFMSMGDKTVKRVKSSLLDMVLTEIFWGVTTPAQALLMLNGSAPPNAKKELCREFKKDFYDTKMIEKKYLDFLEKVVKLWRDFEHEEIKELSGKEVDELLVGTESYLKRLKDLREQIEKRSQEKIIEQLYKDTFTLLKSMFGNLSQEKIIASFEKQLVKTAKFAPQHLRILKDIVHAREDVRKGKSDIHKVDEARKNASILINDLIEYNQRCDILAKQNEPEKKDKINTK